MRQAGFQLRLTIERYEKCCFSKEKIDSRASIKIPADNKNEIKDNDLKQFVDSLNFERVRVTTSDGDIYYLFDKETGISLV